MSDDRRFPGPGHESKKAGSPSSERSTEAHEHILPADAGVPNRIAQYRIKRAIASGGMGTVYEALQEKPRRTVAIKLMRPGIASRSALRRFDYESQLLARLRHPGIAQVYEAGTHREGEFTLPYFAMEYIVGAKPITDYVKDKRLNTRERMRLFADVCDAVQHGHQKGIIHRDLKPSNILVDSSGQVKVIDFGVARSTDSDMALTTLQTDVGQLIGTLQYMSPEQCAADPHDIDVRSDVYALGVVFYEMLCDRPPYELKGAMLHEATRVIREDAPTRLSTLNRTLRGDVETIALKALEKERDRRYQSASDLRQDIHRYLSHEPIAARRASLLYTLRVFARRNRAAFIAAVAIALTLLTASVVSTTLYVRAQRAESRALKAAEVSKQEARRAERIQGFLVNMLQAVDPARAKGEEVTVAQVLEQAAANIGTELADEPDAEIGVREAIAGTLEGLGRFGDAVEQRSEVVELSRRVDGPDSRRGLWAEVSMALAMYQDGRTRDALERMRALTPRVERVFGRESEAYVRNQQAIGNAMRALGQAEQAQPIMEGALDIARRILGTENNATATSILDLGWVYLELQRYADAEPLFLEGVAMREKLLGRESPWVIRPKHELANLYLKMGRYDDAERWSRDALETARQILPGTHTDLHWSLARHVFALEGLGRFPEAEQGALELHALKVEQHGPTSTEAAEYLKALARIAGRQNATDRQRKYQRERLTAFRANADDPQATADTLNEAAMALLTAEPEDLQDPETAVGYAERAVAASEEKNPAILDTLALALSRAGDLDRAIEIQRRAISMLSVEDRFTLTLLHRFGDFVKEEGNLDEIEPVLRSLWRKRRDALGESDNRTVEVLTALSIILNKVDRYDQAAEVNQEILDVVRRKHGAEHPEVALALGNLGAALVLAERAGEAEPYLHESVEMYERVSGPASFAIGNFRSWLGRCLGMRDRFEEGARELSTAYDVLAPREDGKERARRAATWLVELYERWDAADPGKGHAAGAAEWRHRLS